MKCSMFDDGNSWCDTSLSPSPPQIHSPHPPEMNWWSHEVKCHWWTTRGVRSPLTMIWSRWLSLQIEVGKRSVIYCLKPTNTCCRRHKHGDEHMLLPRMVMWQRWAIVCGEGQEEAVINAQISASSAKHSAMSLTASLPLLLLSVFSLLSDWDKVKITPGGSSGASSGLIL